MPSVFLGLAPMAGLTDWPLRVLCYRAGADYACSEMVSALGLRYAKKGNETYEQLLYVHPEETNTACQLFGSDPDAMGEASAKITALSRFHSIDINMGCPARKVVGGGDGSALLRNPELAARVMEAVKRNTHLPVTLKTRLGYDENSLNARLLCEAAQDLGFRWVTIHGRTREQQYSGKADWEAIARIRQEVRIPIVANGDLFSADAAQQMRDIIHPAGYMLARGVLGNPWLFRSVRNRLEGKEAEPTIAQAERLKTALLHAEWMMQAKGEHLGMLEMRKHVGHYIGGIHGASAIRRELNTVTSLAQLKALLQTLTEEEL